MSGVCPTCDGAGCVRCDPDFDPTPQHQWEVTQGWTPVWDDRRDEHSPEREIR